MYPNAYLYHIYIYLYLYAEILRLKLRNGKLALSEARIKNDDMARLLRDQKVTIASLLKQQANATKSQVYIYMSVYMSAYVRYADVYV